MTAFTKDDFAKIAGKDSPAINKDHKMKISARNQLKGIITQITEGAVNSEVSLRLANDQLVTAIITAASVKKLA